MTAATARMNATDYAELPKGKVFEAAPKGTARKRLFRFAAGAFALGAATGGYLAYTQGKVQGVACAQAATAEYTSTMAERGDDVIAGQIALALYEAKIAACIGRPAL